MDITDLKRLVGDEFTLEEFIDRIPMIGATVEKVEGEEISVEFFPNRPDLFCVEGVASAYNAFLGKEISDLSKKMKVEDDSGMALHVDQSVLEVRPVIGAAYLTGVNIDERTLVSIMNLQEKLHITVGRKRRKVAIGIHDADRIKGPFKYWAAEPNEVKFVPLQKEDEWDLERILKEHEKGVDYAWILQDLEKYPMITDSKEQVLSFPPIINGELTRVSEDTKNIFVDCTGWDLNAVTLSVNIVCSQLMARGGKLHSVKVVYPKQKGFKELDLETRSWPRYHWSEYEIDLEWAESWLGKELPENVVKDSLKKMGFERATLRKGKVKCLVPPWRGDILHQADIAEDLAIGIGFENFSGAAPKMNMTGNERMISKATRSLRNTLVGLGFLEVRTISLSNEKIQFSLMGRTEKDHIKITNPITTEHTMMRSSSIPSLLNILKTNKHRDLPQSIFEAADVMIGNRSCFLLSGLSEDNKASFTGIKGVVQKILSDLELEFELDQALLGCYIKGRGAAVYVKGEADGAAPFPELEKDGMIALGHFGEIHPGMISEMELPAPVSGFERDLSMIVKLLGK
jgi:phenylalanyl-tRNA synthetase beta chain